MKIVLYGASGMIGSRIPSEALSRRHAAVAGAPKSDNTAALAAAAAGADVAISAYSPGNEHSLLTKNTYALLDGLAHAGVSRVIVVGGAASLEVAPGKRLIDAPGFPDIYRARATEQA